MHLSLSGKNGKVNPLKTESQIFRKAADLISTKYRADLVAAVMLGQVHGPSILLIIFSVENVLSL